MNCVARRKRNDRNVVFIRKGIIRICVFIRQRSDRSFIFIRKRNNRGIDAECIEDAFSYGKGDIAEVIVKEHVVRVRIDKSDFDKNRRHFCASEDNEPGAGFYSEIYKTDPLKLFVYIFRHLQFNAGFVVDKRFDSRDSVILRKRITMDRDEKIDSGFICFH